MPSAAVPVADERLVLRAVVARDRFCVGQRLLHRLLGGGDAGRLEELMTEPQTEAGSEPRGSRVVGDGDRRVRDLVVGMPQLDPFEDLEKAVLLPGPRRALLGFALGAFFAAPGAGRAPAAGPRARRRRFRGERDRRRRRSGLAVRGSSQPSASASAASQPAAAPLGGCATMIEPAIGASNLTTASAYFAPAASASGQMTTLRPASGVQSALPAASEPLGEVTPT